MTDLHILIKRRSAYTDAYSLENNHAFKFAVYYLTTYTGSVSALSLILLCDSDCVLLKQGR